MSSFFNYEINLFPETNKIVPQLLKRVTDIAQGRGSISYQESTKTVIEFEEMLKNGSDIFFAEWRKYLIISDRLATSNDFMKKCLEYQEEFKEFINSSKNFLRGSITKNFYRCYFTHFEKLQKEKLLELFSERNKFAILQYVGKNRLFLNLKVLQEQGIDLNIPEAVLAHYNEDLDWILNDLPIGEAGEYIRVLQNLKFVSAITNLNFDENVPELFFEIICRKETYCKENFLLKEYISKILIDKAMVQNKNMVLWRDFILELLGDPRSSSFYGSKHRSWDVLGKERKDFFVKNLSQDDLKLFLESLSDSVSDTHYEYRKAFWLAFIDYVKFAKVFVGNNAYNALDPILRDKIKKHDSSYARLSSQEQSAIYIDFGVIKVIEFTHNGKVRGFSECPINLKQATFASSELKTERYILKYQSQPDKFLIPHSSPANAYIWQPKVLRLMNHHLKTIVRDRDVYISQDKARATNYVGPFTGTVQPIRESIQQIKINPEFKKCPMCGANRSGDEYSENTKGYLNGSWCIDCFNQQPIDSKVCIECKKVKPVNEFFVKQNGLIKLCKQCDSKKEIHEGKKLCSTCKEFKSRENFSLKAKNHFNQDVCDKCSKPKNDVLKFCIHCNKSKLESSFLLSKDKVKKAIWCDDCINTLVEKECAKCQIVKPVAEFSKSQKDPSGYTVWCKKCQSWF